MDVRDPPFTMFCRRLDRGLLWAHTRPSLGLVRPLSRVFRSFGRRGAVRPIEASKAAIRNGCFTSSPVSRRGNQTSDFDH